MVRCWPGRCRCRNRFPHACGDGPVEGFRMTFGNKFSPRVWGWSDLMAGRYDNAIVFPTRVGMVRSFAGGRPACASFPHACGDGPFLRDMVIFSTQFSPRVWGWSESCFEGGVGV